jgi:hypothetical protein
LAALAALAFVTALVRARAYAQVTSRPRTVVLRFEGWRADQARQATIDGLRSGYELLDEQTLIHTAARIAVDVSTPEGMAAVVEHLGVMLVVGGFIEGRGRGSTTTVWVMDARGNELSRRTTRGPVGRQTAGDISAAAAEAAAEAIALLTRPPPPEPPPPEPEPAPPVHRMLREDEPAPDVSGRWTQPWVRALVGLRIRNRTAAVSPDARMNRFDADFFPDIQLQVEVRPLARAEGAERGLYFALSGGFSVGLGYFRRPPNDREAVPMQVYNFELDAGYGLVLAEVAEIVLSAGFAIDGFDLADPGPTDFVSARYSVLRPAIQGRFRLVPDQLLLAEVGFGGRIVLDTGALAAAYGPAGTGGGGIDFSLGLAGIVNPGFTWAIRFSYTAYFLSYSGLVHESGTDEALQFWLMVGWAI